MLWVSLVFVGLVPALDAAGVWLFKLLVDDVLMVRDLSMFPPLAAAFVGLTLVSGAVSMADGYLSTWIGERFLLDLRERLFDHVQGLSSNFFDRRSLGDTLSRITSDVATIEAVVLSGLTSAVSNSLKIAVFAGILFYLQWQMALLALVTAPFFLISARFFSRRIKQISREQRRRVGALTAVAEESLGNAVLVQAYNRQKAESARFRTESVGGFRAQLSATRWRGIFSALMDLLEVVGVLLIVGFGVWQLTLGTITLGGLLVFLAYTSLLMSPIRRFGRLANSMAAAGASAERLIELFDQRPAVPVVSQPHRLGRATGIVAFSRVTFTYPGSRRFAAFDVSFAARVRARWWRSSAPVAPASRRSRGCCCGCTTRSGARSRWTGTTCATSTPSTCAGTSQWCCRRPSSSTPRSARTSSGAARTRRQPRCTGPPAMPTPTTSSQRCRTATTPASASAADFCRVASASASPSPEPSSAMRRYSFSTSPPPASTRRRATG